MKKLLCALVATTALVSSAYAADISIKVDGADLATDVAPIEQNDRVFVPMRAIFEKLGCTVEWLEDDQLICAYNSTGDVMLMQIGQSAIRKVNISDSSKSEYTMDVVPFVKDDRTLVPIRAVSETLGCTVDWDDATQTVSITTTTAE